MMFSNYLSAVVAAWRAIRASAGLFGHTAFDALEQAVTPLVTALHGDMEAIRERLSALENSVVGEVAKAMSEAADKLIAASESAAKSLPPEIAAAVQGTMSEILDRLAKVERAVGIYPRAAQVDPAPATQADPAPAAQVDPAPAAEPAAPTHATG